MEKQEQLADRLREVFIDGTWIAHTNFQEALSDVSVGEANQVVAGLNTLYQLAFHVDYYVDGLCTAYQTGVLAISDKNSFPAAAPANESEWQHFKAKATENARKLIGIVSEMSGEMLDGPFVEVRYGTNRRNLEALIEHAYYHLGQISLIKKMAREFNW